MGAGGGSDAGQRAAYYRETGLLVWWNQQDAEWQVLPEDHAGVAGDVHIVPCVMRQGKRIARLDFGCHDFSLSRQCVCHPEVRVHGDRVSILHRQAVN